MSQKIDRDVSRFKDIIKGRIRKDLRKHISKGEMIGKKGKDRVSIPIHHLDIPRFRFGDKDSGGTGQGDGEPGDPVGGQEQEGQEGSGKAGKDPGEHALEVEMTLDELADILGEELELPNIENKGKQSISSEKDRYTGISKVGPESLRHFKRTYREALKRTIASGCFVPGAPIVAIPDDKRYRSWKVRNEPVANAAIIYMMDVSGSMGDEQKEIVRIESFWIDTWLQRQYDGIETRYVIHDTQAKEVDQDTFFRTRESGGTMISSAYKLGAEIISKHYPFSEWNNYVFHFSDGDNWSKSDADLAISIVKDEILPSVNMVGYGQVDSTYGTGDFIKWMRSAFYRNDKVILSEIHDKDNIIDSIKEFLGKGN